MATNKKFSGLARRLKNAGLKVNRSDRSETIYLAVGPCELRISGHELGWADYGTRQQKHRGPEVVTDLNDLGAFLYDAIYAVRDYIGDCRKQLWTESQRTEAAKAICALRKLSKKLA